MPVPEFRFYARAVIERNHLSNDTADLRGEVSELRLAIGAKNDQLRGDSSVVTQKTKVITIQQELLQTSANDLRKQKGKTSFWKVTTVILGVTSAVLFLR